jgi:multicomponent K+:H+ antiporter subunit F
MTSPVLIWAIDIASVAVAIAMVLCAYRLWLGPETTDRILALDTLYMTVVALVVLLGLKWQTALLFEIALLVALLGFVGTVALARYITRGDVVE